MSGPVPDRSDVVGDRGEDALGLDPDRPLTARGFLLDQLLPAATHYAAVAADDDPDLRS
jgi:hypothetical protein